MADHGFTPGSQPTFTGRTSNISRAEHLLSSLETRAGLTPAGKEWVLAAVDPFHDHAYTVNGYPDGASINTVTQIVKRSFTVTAPTQDGTWDCNIFTLPVLQSMDLVEPAEDGLGVQCPFAGSFLKGDGLTKWGSTGTVNAVAVPSGVGTLPQGTGAGQVVVPSSALWHASGPTRLSEPTSFSQPSDNFTNGLHRLIAGGFEVVNTSPPLYAGGAATPYFQPLNQQTVSVVNVLGGNVVTTQPSILMDISSLPPATLDEAMLLPDSTQWPAIEGSYTVFRNEGLENPFVRPTQMYSLHKGATEVPGNPVDSNGVVTFSAGLLVGGLGIPNVPGTFVPLMTSYARIATSGVYYTGLSPQTTLQVNCRFIMERAPTVFDTDLVPLARPPPPYDPVAFALYTELIRTMPPGVRLSENALGQWFRDAVGTVLNSPITPAVLSLVPHPAAQVAATVIRGAQGHGAKGSKPSANKKQKKQLKK